MKPVPRSWDEVRDFLGGLGAVDLQNALLGLATVSIIASLVVLLAGVGLAIARRTRR